MPVPCVIKSARARVCNTLCHHQYGAQQACALMLGLCRTGLVYAACVVCSIRACGVLSSSHCGYPPCIGCVIPVSAVLCLEPLSQPCIWRMHGGLSKGVCSTTPRVTSSAVHTKLAVDAASHKACSGCGLVVWMWPITAVLCGLSDPGKTCHKLCKRQPVFPVIGCFDKAGTGASIPLITRHCSDWQYALHLSLGLLMCVALWCCWRFSSFFLSHSLCC
jgi:hypothetical protein